jgi:phosphoglycolate phosphatase-like HAD superfamily hydrolase
MIKNIIFDFDGVILDSVSTKTEGFKKLFQDFPNIVVDKLIEYHIQNGGISRYRKIKYFFNELLKQEISEDEVLNYANRYSDITKEELTNPKYMIEDAVNFIKQNHKKYNMHIASGADENDLRHICEKLDLSQYFLSIHGSPTIKLEIVRKILESNNYKNVETILIGDSINDYKATKVNGIEFYGYNNLVLKEDHKYFLKLEGINFE